MQTGVATGDSVGALFAQTVAEQVWVLQNCFRLLRATSQLQSAVQRIGSVDDATAADVIGEEIEGVFRLASSLQRKIAPRLRAAQYRPAQQGVAGALEALRSIALGADGLVAAKRELSSAAAQIKGGTSTLDAIETRYFSILADIEGAVRARNEAAKTQAGDASRIGRNVIAALVLVSAMFAVGAALFLRRRIVAPVNDLAAHMARVGDSGVPDAISDRSTLQSRDEFGDLARAFNRMLAELAGARRELIQKSDAEIGKQVERLQAAADQQSQGLCMFDRLGAARGCEQPVRGARIRPDAGSAQECCCARSSACGWPRAATTAILRRRQTGISPSTPDREPPTRSSSSRTGAPSISSGVPWAMAAGWRPTRTSPSGAGSRRRSPTWPGMMR